MASAHWQEVLFWLGIVFSGKALIIFAICLALKMSPAYALATGITLAQIGEFSFVLATEAKNGGLIDEHIFSLAVAVTILSMLLAPYMVSYARPAARRVIGLFTLQTRRPPAEPENVPLAQKGGVFIVGFGPAGRKVARALLEKAIQPQVIELNPCSSRRP
jgi:CPA2 family monovalent cation:H+ antiporter-2